MASGRIAEYKDNIALLKVSSMVGVFLGRFRKEEPSAYENNFAELFSLYEQSKLKPIVTESFAFEDYVAAFNVFTERKVMGKVTLEIKTEAQPQTKENVTTAALTFDSTPQKPTPNKKPRLKHAQRPTT